MRGRVSSKHFPEDDADCPTSRIEVSGLKRHGRFAYADTHYDRDIRTYCKQKKIIYQSFWTLNANPHLLTHATMTALART